jgi:hypothetical protein
MREAEYFERGCQQARQTLSNGGFRGLGGMREPIFLPKYTSRTLDALQTFITDHLEYTAVAVGSFPRFLKPGELLLTLTLNLFNEVLSALRVTFRSLYAMHVSLSCGSLAQARQSSALETVCCNRFLFERPGVTNIENQRSASFHKTITGLRVLTLKPACISEEAFPLSRPGRCISSCGPCVGKKQCA